MIKIKVYLYYCFLFLFSQYSQMMNQGDDGALWTKIVANYTHKKEKKKRKKHNKY